MSDDRGDKELIESLLELYHRLFAVLTGPLQSNPDFFHAFHEAFENFLNSQNKSRPAESLARFLDDKLKGSRGGTEIELHDMLSRVMSLFRYIQGFLYSSFSMYTAHFTYGWFSFVFVQEKMFSKLITNLCLQNAYSWEHRLLTMLSS
jgi:hypothetical protein